MTDEFFMREALAEAAKGLGRTMPNPPVGAVVVNDGLIIGRGHHEFAGGPHAETNALRNCKIAKTFDSTLYVTLEPCSTLGRTPPCTDAIIKAGITRVVVACEDDNPKHRGAGIRMLREAGIEAVCGVCEAEAREMLAPFFKHVKTGLPYLTLKMAQSLDGGIADHCGVSKWITCGESRAYVKNVLRMKCDAVMVGSGTVIADNPSLLRPDGTGLRVVLEGTRKVPESAKIFTDGHEKQTLVFRDTQTRMSVPHSFVEFPNTQTGMSVPRSSEFVETPAGAPWKKFRLLGRLSPGYVLLETDDGLVILDPAAAHERVIYEKLLGETAGARAMSQTLLFPQTVEMAPLDFRRVENVLPELRKFGFGINPLEKKAFIVDALPDVVSDVPCKDLLTDIAEAYEQAGLKRGREKLHGEIIAKTASKAAVRLGGTLGDAALFAIICDLARCAMPYANPSGRPTTHLVSLNELNRRFGR